MNLTHYQSFSARYKAFIQREILSKEDSLLFVLLFLFLLNVGILGYFGIYLGIQNALRKSYVIQTLRTQEQTLATNLAKISEAGAFLTSEPIVRLNLMIPDERKQTDFMSALTTTAGNYGLTVAKIDFTTGISLIVRGDYTRLSSFIRDVQSMPRLTVIDSVEISRDRFDRPAQVSVSLRIFSLATSL